MHPVDVVKSSGAQSGILADEKGLNGISFLSKPSLESIVLSIAEF